MRLGLEGVPTYLASLLVHLLPYVCTYLPTCFLTCAPTSLLVHLPTYLLPYLGTYFLTWAPTYLLASLLGAPHLRFEDILRKDVVAQGEDESDDVLTTTELLVQGYQRHGQ